MTVLECGLCGSTYLEGRPVHQPVCPLRMRATPEWRELGPPAGGKRRRRGQYRAQADAVIAKRGPKGR